jgi:hypothetical protein
MNAIGRLHVFNSQFSSIFALLTIFWVERPSIFLAISAGKIFAPLEMTKSRNPASAKSPPLLRIETRAQQSRVLAHPLMFF